MKTFLAGIIAAGIMLPAFAQAQTCADSAPPAINIAGAVDKASAKCLSAMAKSSTKFISAKLKALAKCETAHALGACPTIKDTDKIQKTALKSIDKIAKSCDASALAGLPNTSYNNTAGGDPFTGADVGSCLLSQNNVESELLLRKLAGIQPGVQPGTNTTGIECADALLNVVGKNYGKILKTINKCIDKQIKGGATGDLGPVCAPSYVGGSYVAPTEAKTAGKLQKTIDKMLATIDKDCPAAVESFFVPRMFACPGAATVEDLHECAVCGDSDSAWAEINSILEAQYAETGIFVAHGADAIQNAHDAAAPNTKLLIEGGQTYNEDVSVTVDGTQFVGCGGATNDRPVIEPGGGSGTNRGFEALGVDNTLYQSLQPNNWDSDGIFVSGVDENNFSTGVGFRDIVADGQINSRYIIFPAFMDGVLVELNEAFDCDDAALYVGKSANIVTRYNETYGNVAGIEIENCDNAETHNNYTHDNTAGLLVFLDSTLLPRSNDNNHTYHNMVMNNNVPNFAPSGFVTNLLDGTGVLLISTTNNEFNHNHIEGNNTIGLALLDQYGVNAFAGNVWPEADGVPGDVCTDNYIHNNTGLDTNGAMPDPDLGIPARNIIGFGEELRAVSTGATNTGTCYEDNSLGEQYLLFDGSGVNTCP